MWEMQTSTPLRQPGVSTSSDAEPLLTEALARWQAADIDVSILHGIDIRIADLGGTTLGLASGNTIWLDDNAAGHGWFVDPTPGNDSEFTTPGNHGEQRKIDLLTTLMHEVGHLLGLDHTTDPGAIMAPRVSVLTLSQSDIATMRLIYEVMPGTIK